MIEETVKASYEAAKLFTKNNIPFRTLFSKEFMLVVMKYFCLLSMKTRSRV